MKCELLTEQNLVLLFDFIDDENTKSENRKAVTENKEHKQDWIDELAMLDEIFDD